MDSKCFVLSRGRLYRHWKIATLPNIRRRIAMKWLYIIILVGTCWLISGYETLSQRKISRVEKMLKKRFRHYLDVKARNSGLSDRITFDRWEDMKARVQDKVPGLLESVIVGMAKGEAKGQSMRSYIDEKIQHYGEQVLESLSEPKHGSQRRDDDDDNYPNMIDKTYGGFG
ncbi:hypothetical protein ScPMuIL_015384 [Solemya velum]